MTRRDDRILFAELLTSTLLSAARFANRPCDPEVVSAKVWNLVLRGQRDELEAVMDAAEKLTQALLEELRESRLNAEEKKAMTRDEYLEASLAGLERLTTACRLKEDAWNTIRTFARRLAREWTNPEPPIIARFVALGVPVEAFACAGSSTELRAALLDFERQHSRLQALLRQARETLAEPAATTTSK